MKFEVNIGDPYSDHIRIFIRRCLYFDFSTENQKLLIQCFHLTFFIIKIKLNVLMGSTNFSFPKAYAFRKLVSENKVKTSIFKIQAFKF
ncbi:hypothetical protein RO3G_14535 [Rhizopus delemar RA 99-880]|uniref:Uncharacterized protein n=1 Tax=Rhizopus delemar (strain RA 99-880 / ATCC MYA-4621 / FGSC 9543 / NRRL 43880) TaxID=246409 RepID=I1CMZ4_RHIO9|nr:hypothetical protein RO3G_14535 [Rhizopus delemar RA 99-880]|eukprot:EIE89824.1 hypothetical protein RO3G_14535 [Rhizopus delemar RA 99-880]